MVSADQTVLPKNTINLDGWEEFDYDDDEQDPYTSDDEAFSFDMSTFDENYPDEDFSSPEEKKLYRTYVEQITKSQGFYVDYYADCPAIGGIVPVEKDMQCPNYIRAIKSTYFAIRTHNKQPGSNKLEFVDIVRVTDRYVAGYLFYITFLAVDIESGEQKTYQTKVYDDRVEGIRKLLLLREEPQASIDARLSDS